MALLQRGSRLVGALGRSSHRAPFSQYTKLGNPKMVSKISDLTKGQVETVLELAHKMKENPPAYYTALENETLLMLFEKPSLRTRVSLEVGMTELGGHAIAYMIGDSPLGKKETFGDTVRMPLSAPQPKLGSVPDSECALHRRRLACPGTLPP